MPTGLVRYPNATAKIADRITTMTVNLMRVSAGMRRTILRQLEALEAELVRDILVAGDKTPLSLARLSALLKQTRSTISTAYGKIAADTPASLAEIATTISRRTISAVNTAVKVELMTVALSPEQIQYIAGKTVVNGRFPAQWWGKQSVRLRDKFSETMRLGQYRGETVDQLIGRVRGTKALDFRDGIMTASKRQAEALVRTSVIAVSNEAKLATYVNNRDVIKGIQWVATLDDRTTEICEELNGKVWLLPESGDKDGDYEPDGHDIPFPGATAHWQCRSVQVPVTLSFDELRAQDAEPEPENG